MTSSVLPHNKEAMDYLHSASGHRTKSHPADGRPYNPNDAKADYGAKIHPQRTMVVLQTMTQSGAPEFRIGIVKRSDLETGLRCGDGTNLNKYVAEKRFTGQVYLSEVDALKAAEQEIGKDPWPEGGIKIIRSHEQFPGVHSSLPRFRQ